MSIIEVAKLAGVSTATVSRVLNNSPRVSADTAAAVRRVMQETNFARRRAPRRVIERSSGAAKGTRIGFLVFGSLRSVGGQPAVFQELLRGVSSATTQRDLAMTFANVQDDGEIPKSMRQPNVDALLLHGDPPPPHIGQLINDIPAAWLMANRQRAPWGDQVMPDNTLIGQIAADYLVQRGHRRLAFLSMVWWGWYWKLRAGSFVHQAQELGVDVTVLPKEAMNLPLEARKARRSAEEIVDRLLRLNPRPTGLFIGEDAQVPQIVAALHQRGLKTGPGADFEIIGCNNDAVHFSGLGYAPATIDIQAEAIGRRGVELLLSRLENPDAECVRMLVQPVLVPARA